MQNDIVLFNRLPIPIFHYILSRWFTIWDPIKIFGLVCKHWRSSITMNIAYWNARSDEFFDTYASLLPQGVANTLADGQYTLGIVERSYIPHYLSGFHSFFEKIGWDITSDLSWLTKRVKFAPVFPVPSQVADHIAYIKSTDTYKEYIQDRRKALRISGISVTRNR